MKISYLRVRNKWKNIDNQKEYNIYFNRIIVITNNKMEETNFACSEMTIIIL